MGRQSDMANSRPGRPDSDAMKRIAWTLTFHDLPASARGARQSMSDLTRAR